MLFVRVLCASAVRVGVCGVCVCLGALKTPPNKITTSQAVFFRHIFSWPASENAPRGHRWRRPRPLHARRAGLDCRPMLLIGVLLARPPPPRARIRIGRAWWPAPLF